MINNNKIYNPLEGFHKAMLKLENSGVRPTKQRRVLAKLLFEKGKRHVCADELYDEVRKEDRKISLATVYNCLDTLVECDLVKQVNLDRSPSRFCPNRNPHAHFRCRETGKVYDVALDHECLFSLEQILPDEFQADTIELSFAGTGPESSLPAFIKPSKDSPNK